MKRLMSLTVAMSLGVVTSATASAPSLRGSPASMIQQNQVAKDHSLSFNRTGAQIRQAVERGELVELKGNADYSVADFVSFPFLQPEGLLFVERLAAQYREACGQKLVVTSAVRPSSAQPSNAHQLSVHPAGMAVDLRVSDRAECRSWLESSLLAMEGAGVLNGIRENRPPHYHVAVFPKQYREYAEAQMAIEAEEALALAEEEAARLAVAPRVAEVISEAGVASALVSADPEKSSGAARTAVMAVLAIPFGIGMTLRKRLRRDSRQRTALTAHREPPAR
jgi:hypothetical protein